MIFASQDYEEDAVDHDDKTDPLEIFNEDNDITSSPRQTASVVPRSHSKINAAVKDTPAVVVTASPVNDQVASVGVTRPPRSSSASTRRALM